MAKAQLTPIKNITSPNLMSIIDSATKSNCANNFFLNMPSNQTPLSISNPFQLNFENYLISHKRYRDENHYNYSPNINSGIVKSFPPAYDYYSPNIFIFNNSGSNTPMKIIQSNNTYVPNQNNFDYNLSIVESLTMNHLSSASENNIKSNQMWNSVDSVENSDKPVNDIRKSLNVEIPKVVLLSKNNSNVGFYSWVLQGSASSKVVSGSRSNLKYPKKKKKNL